MWFIILILTGLSCLPPGIDLKSIIVNNCTTPMPNHVICTSEEKHRILFTLNPQEIIYYDPAPDTLHTPFWQRDLEAEGCQWKERYHPQYRPSVF